MLSRGSRGESWATEGAPGFDVTDGPEGLAVALA
jgi:hypothetical protein